MHWVQSCAHSCYMTSTRATSKHNSRGAHAFVCFFAYIEVTSSMWHSGTVQLPAQLCARHGWAIALTCWGRHLKYR